MPGYYEFKPELNGIQRKARNSLGRFQKLQGVALEVHKEAIAEMAKVAGDVLKDRTKDRERGPFGRSGRLEAGVRDPASSRATVDGFEFLLQDRMNEIAVYWRAIEYGSSHLVGRKIHLAFSHGGRPVSPDASRRGRDSGLVSPGLTGLVRINNPIPAYGYAEAAEDWFRADDFEWYKNAMKRVAASRGLTIS